MLIVSDFQGFSTVAENIDSLYNTITYDLGLEEWQQEKLVDELNYQFGDADDRMIELENENEDLQGTNDDLDMKNQQLEDENLVYEEKNDELGDEILELEKKNEELRDKLENIEKSKEAAYKAKLDKIKAILDLDDEELANNEETVEAKEKQADVENEQDTEQNDEQVESDEATPEKKHSTSLSLSTPWSANVSSFSKMLADLKLIMIHAYEDNGKVLKENDPMLKTRKFMTYVNVVIKYGNKIVSEDKYRTVTEAKEAIKQAKARFKGAEKPVYYSLKINKAGQWWINC